MKVNKEQFIRDVKIEALRRRIAEEKKLRAHKEEELIEEELDIPPLPDPLDPFDV